MSWYKQFLFCLLLIIPFSFVTAKQHLFFDLNGVLIDTNRTDVILQVGIVNCTLSFLTFYDIKQLMFDFLVSLRGPQIQTDPTHYTLGDDQPLPHIWYQHMNGEVSGLEVINEAKANIDTCQASERAKQTLLALITTIFDPQIMSARCMYPIKKGCDLLADLAQQPDVECWIVSNLGADAYEALLQREDMQEAIFQYIPEHHRIISGKVGMSKPHPSIFELVKDKLIEEDPQCADLFYLASHCLGVDDQIENVNNLIQAGIPAYHLTPSKSYLYGSNHYQELRNKLKILNYLPLNT